MTDKDSGQDFDVNADEWVGCGSSPMLTAIDALAIVESCFPDNLLDGYKASAQSAAMLLREALTATGQLASVDVPRMALSAELELFLERDLNRRRRLFYNELGPRFWNPAKKRETT